MYCITQKIKGKKYIVATWIGNKKSCPRLAEEVFKFHGILGRVEFLDVVLKEKMFNGYSDNCQKLNTSIDDAEIIFDVAHVNNYLRMGRDQEYILNIEPEFKKYFSSEFEHFLIRKA